MSDYEYTPAPEGDFLPPRAVAFLVILFIVLCAVMSAAAHRAGRKSYLGEKAWLEGYRCGLDTAIKTFSPAITNRTWDGEAVHQAIDAGMTNCPYK